MKPGEIKVGMYVKTNREFTCPVGGSKMPAGTKAIVDHIGWDKNLAITIMVLAGVAALSYAGTGLRCDNRLFWGCDPEDLDKDGEKLF